MQSGNIKRDAVLRNTVLAFRYYVGLSSFKTNPLAKNLPSDFLASRAAASHYQSWKKYIQNGTMYYAIALERTCRPQKDWRVGIEVIN